MRGYDSGHCIYAISPKHFPGDMKWRRRRELSLRMRDRVCMIFQMLCILELTVFRSEGGSSKDEVLRPTDMEVERNTVCMMHGKC